MPTIVKWGFGRAPLKNANEIKYASAITAVKNFVSGSGMVDLESLPDSISTVKGMFNRVIRQDQWDWFTVNMYFDYPTPKDVMNIVRALVMLRTSILNMDYVLKEKSIKDLLKSNFEKYCSNYLSFDIKAETKAEYLYILSRREERDILKIGMTTRNVQKRVNEINSSTGVLYPYSARKVYKVKNSHTVEKDIHKLLDSYRIRTDREFFKISYKDACDLIEKYLDDTNQYYYD